MRHSCLGVLSSGLGEMTGPAVVLGDGGRLHSENEARTPGPQERVTHHCSYPPAF
jgi:hypothetical protein